MTNQIIAPKATEFERVERNQLFTEFEQQALRVTRECANEPYGDFPGTQLDFFAAYLDGMLPLKQRPGTEAAKAREKFDRYAMKQRSKAVGSLSMGTYFFNEALGYATFYETREQGTGLYYRLRTVKEVDARPEPAVVISDYAVKPTPPNRSINWLIATRTARDDFLLERDDLQQPEPHVESSYRTWPGTDLMPGKFQPRNEADYQRVKLRLLETITVLGKMSRANVVSDLLYLPAPVARHLASPVVYSLMGPQF
jgi:hypothetical protein